MVAGRDRLVLLGGTSNHFRRDVLIASGGWDPFNVTEDADLAVRLRRMGYTLSMIDSYTEEEAPITANAWLKQRSSAQDLPAKDATVDAGQALGDAPGQYVHQECLSATGRHNGPDNATYLILAAHRQVVGASCRCRRPLLTDAPRSATESN